MNVETKRSSGGQAGPLISAADLQARLEKGGVQLIDASYFLPEHGRDAREEYEAGHLPGAVFLDLDEVSDQNTSLPNMLPTAEYFAARMESLGVSRDQPNIVYDNSPLHSSGRAWWMLRLFGAGEVLILDGGQPAWVAAGGALEQGTPNIASGKFPAVADFSSVADIDQVKQILASGTRQVVDARSPSRFSGEEAEARPNMRAGHMPGAHNVPNSALFEADGCYKSAEQLSAVFEAAGVDLKAPIVASCGSGVTAANIIVAATIIGVETPVLYDGSWAEWGGRPDTDIVGKENG